MLAAMSRALVLRPHACRSRRLFAAVPAILQVVPRRTRRPAAGPEKIAVGDTRQDGLGGPAPPADDARFHLHPDEGR